MLRNIIFLLSAVEAKYRILSLDSATYSGLMTAEFVSFMEKKAYLISRSLKCLTERESERVAMHELFDMIAGSETGAIIASSLVVPHDDASSPQKNKYWATQSVDFFMENTDTFYVDSSTSNGVKMLITAIFLVFFGLVSYKLAEYYFKHKDTEDKFEVLKKVISKQKKLVKGNLSEQDFCSDPAYDTAKNKVFVAAEEEKEDEDKALKDIQLKTIWFDILPYQKCIQEEKERDEVLNKLKVNLDKIEKYEHEYISKQGYKFYILFLVSIAVGLMLYFWFIPFVDFLTLTSAPNTELSAKIDEFIPEITADKVITDDFLLTSWEMNNRDPYIFSKNMITQEPTKYDAFNKLNLMTFLSAVNPLYFLPFKSGEDKVFISGNAAAESPAMFAYLYATEYGQNPEDIEVVSIGSIEERPNKIPSDIGVLEWTARIQSLQGPVKSYA